MTGSPSSAMALYPSISVLLLASRRRKACPAIATGFAIKLRASVPAHKLLGATAGGRGVLCRDQRRAGANLTQRTGPEVKIGAAFALQAIAMGRGFLARQASCAKVAAWTRRQAHC